MALGKTERKGFIPKEDIEKVKSAARTTDVVGERIPLKGHGRYATCNCPFHDDRKGKLTVWEDGGWECMDADCPASRHRMGGQGDAITFVMMYEGKDFTEAVESLASRYGVAVSRTGAEKSREERRADRREKRSERASIAGERRSLTRPGQASSGAKAVKERAARSRPPKEGAQGRRPEQRPNGTVKSSFMSEDDAARLGISAEKYAFMKAAYESKRKPRNVASSDRQSQQRSEKQRTPRAGGARSASPQSQEKVAPVRPAVQAPERKPTLHVGILGGPGCGKQDVAFALARTLQELGWKAVVLPSVPEAWARDGYAEALAEGSVMAERCLYEAELAQRAEWEGVADITISPNPPIAALARTKESGADYDEFYELAMDRHRTGREFTFFLKRAPGSFDKSGCFETAGQATEVDEMVKEWMYSAKADGFKPAHFDQRMAEEGFVARQIEKVYAKSWGQPAIDVKPRSAALRELKGMTEGRDVATDAVKTALAAGWKPSEAAMLSSLSDERLSMLVPAIERGMGAKEAAEFCRADAPAARKPTSRTPVAARRQQASSPAEERAMTRSARRPSQGSPEKQRGRM